METSMPAPDMDLHRTASSSGAGSVGSARSTLRRYLRWWVRIPTLADVAPSLIQALIMGTGKMSGLVVLGIYLAMVLMWLPFWLLACLVTELGVYVLVVASIWYLGRAVIRMIAFPGASAKVMSEVETEFAKYSVRMLLASATCLSELASALIQPDPSSTTTATTTATSTLPGYELTNLWKRTLSYRDRALGVYLEVLTYLYQQEPPEQGPVSGDSSSSHHGSSSSTNGTQQRTRYGTNRIVGDIGNLKGLTQQAKDDGRELVQLLNKIMRQLDDLERAAGSVLLGTTHNSRNATFAPAVHETATLLLASANELRDFVSSLKPPGTDTNTNNNNSSDQEDAIMRHLGEEQQPGSAMDAIKAGLASILPMLDPPPHTSIFGMDVLRGTVVSRYLGARQLWVARPSGTGMLDVLHIPGRRSSATNNNNNNNLGGSGRQRQDSTATPFPRNKAVLYCNPNAGLYEVATGMSLAGGNISDDHNNNNNNDDDGTPHQQACWTDFYTDLGYDIYLFNYAGFGRSFGTSFCDAGALRNKSQQPGILGRLTRIFHACLLSFKPTPDSLRQDGVALANYIVQELGVEQLIIHGESIGGVAASRSANVLSHQPSTRNKLSLLVCDRTFCNLEAVAQRLVGDWSGYAIRMLAPFWNTDVAADFLMAACPKIVANDFADAIIADSSSLKTGISLWKEIQRGATMSKTKGIGWVMETPLEYRMADWENTCVVGSQYVAGANIHRVAPVWPQDKHITLAEAFHFAACVKRIGRFVKQDKERRAGNLDRQGSSMELERGDDGSASSPIQSAWETLACCDGLCGAPLGMTAKIGFDSTVAWLSCCLTFGGQIVVEAAERRLVGTAAQLQGSNHGGVGGVAGTDRPPSSILPSDFDQRPKGYQRQNSASVVHPIPVPEVVDQLKRLIAGTNNQDTFQPVQHEMDFVVGMLEYIVARLSSASNVETCWKSKHGRPEEASAGIFLNLHCGHNSAFSVSEQEKLRSILQEIVK